MSNELAPMATFMERVKEKLRADIGSLLPDEAMTAMVQKVINETYFESKKVPRPGRGAYSNDTITVDPPFKLMVVDAIKPIIERQVTELMLKNADKIEAQIAEALKDGLAGIVLNSIVNSFRTIMSSQQWNVQNQLEQIVRSQR